MLKPLGIKVNVQRIPWDKFINDIEGKAAFSVDGFYSRPTIDSSIYPFSTAPLVEFDALALQERRDGQDPRRRPSRGTTQDQARHYKQFQVIALQDPPGVIPYVINHINAFSKTVKGFHSSPMMWLDLRQVSLG